VKYQEKKIKASKVMQRFISDHNLDRLHRLLCISPQLGICYNRDREGNEQHKFPQFLRNNLLNNNNSSIPRKISFFAFHLDIVF
jgi:hypothetical protein